MKSDEAGVIANAILGSFVGSDGENISDALYSVSHNLKYLGTGDAATRIGAIELLSKEVKEGSERVADALREIAEAIREKHE